MTAVLTAPAATPDPVPSSDPDRGKTHGPDDPPPESDPFPAPTRPRSPRPRNPSSSFVSNKLRRKSQGDEPVHVTDYGYRYYDPLTGRWPSRDPMGDVAGNYKWFEAQKTMLELVSEIGWQKAMIAADLASIGDIDYILAFDEIATDEISKLRQSLYSGEPSMVINLYLFVNNDPSSFYDYLGLSKGGKRNIGCEGFNLKSVAEDVAKALENAVKNNQQARARALRGLLKVIKRGGTRCLMIPEYYLRLLLEGMDPTGYRRIGTQTCCCDEEDTQS